MDSPSRTFPLAPRQTIDPNASGADKLLSLLADPFYSSLQADSIWASLGTSIGFTVAITIAFSFLRPYNSIVYAPKLKHADDAHAPPAVGKGIFAWIGPVLKSKEEDINRLVGLDATIFLRFTRMCRNMLVVITILGCGILIPINLSMGQKFENTATLTRLTPLNTFGSANYGQVVCAWLFDVVVMGFIWWNYRKVVALRRQYFDSPEYQNSLHARTLMITDIPKNFRSDEGIGRVIDEVVPTSSFCRSSIARNVKELPELIEEHGQAVRQLEKVLAKYLKDPDHLPTSRPMCKPSKKDPSYSTYANKETDAIEYLTQRIRDLELTVNEVRLSIDKRNAMPYGFASYEDIAESHSIAFQARNKHPQGTSIVLAPRPHDVIWQNMPLSKESRRWKSFINNIWVVLLTIVWIAPNAMISIFLVNLTNLGNVWPAFHTQLEVNGTLWAIIQGVASPALTSLIFLLLPIIFRRLAIQAGDRTKTSRERHVTAKLYTFFVFNNLIVFCVFSSIWIFVSNVISITDNGTDAWDAIKQADFGLVLFKSLCGVGPFWITWLLQRNLGAAIDLAQLWTLFWSFCVRKLSSPTPRELIELTAPPSFDYASYYNYFLFYTTVTLSFATIQPLVLPAATLYFLVDVYLKKYLLLYIFVTKTESGGMFWRMLINRLIFASILANLVVFLVLFSPNGDAQHIQAYCVAPLPFIMLGFKYYCVRAFDTKIHYYATSIGLREQEGGIGKSSSKGDRLASRYGHPALYRPLITPMVHAKAQNILASIYRGRLTDSNNADSIDVSSVSGYSDTFALDPMKAGQPGRTKSGKEAVPGFEVVPESHLDFTYYKNRAEFGEDHGAGVIYGGLEDPFNRPGTADTFRGYSSPGSSRTGSPAPQMKGARRTFSGMSSSEGYGYAPPPASSALPGANRFYTHNNNSESEHGLVGGAAAMPMATPYGHTREEPQEQGGRAPGFLGGGPRGYGNLPQDEIEENPGPTHDPMSYDYYRSSRRQGGGFQGWTG